MAIALAGQMQTQASDLKFKYEQVGPDVKMTVSGSINTSSLTTGTGAWSKNTNSAPANAYAFFGVNKNYGLL